MTQKEDYLWLPPLDVLEGEGGRFSGDGVYLQRASITPNDSKGLHLGMDLTARVRHAGLSRARHEQEVPICEGLGMVRR